MLHCGSLAVKFSAAYRRGDLLERRAKLMADWADFLALSVEAGTVVPIRGRKHAGE